MASTPTRDNADVNSIAFIKAFFEDFPGPIATKAADYTKIFDNKGFDSKESLKGILTADQVEKWKIPEGHANQIVQPAQTMQGMWWLWPLRTRKRARQMQGTWWAWSVRSPARVSQALV